MRLAAIDIGSNSLHLVIVEADSAGTFRIIGREKEMVRLGQGLADARLSIAAMDHALQTLHRYCLTAAAHRADRILAVATSAVREAANGQSFLNRIGQELGVWPRAISGEEEARLIYLAAAHSLHLEGKRALVVDIGGGSLEIAQGAGVEPCWVASEKLGVLRLSRAFVGTDPLSSEDERRLEAHATAALEPHVSRALQEGFDYVVGTSGTILALGALAQDMERGTRRGRLHHVKIGAESIHAVRRMLTDSDLAARKELPGMERRADIIVAGGIVLSTLLRLLKAHELVLCEWALREGLLVDYIRGHPHVAATTSSYPEVRRRSVTALADQCHHDRSHSRHVARLALSLFDQAQERHRLGQRERSLLEYAALLHDIGHHIGHTSHHRHSSYIIKNGNLRGFDPTEIEIMASVARYHDGGRPRRKHAGYGRLPRELRRTVKVLAACLRLADAFDHSHRQSVRTLLLAERSGTWRLLCDGEGDCLLEMWAAARAKELFERVLEMPVSIENAPAVTAGPELAADSLAS